MPKQIKDTRKFIEITRRGDARLVKIMKNRNSGETKFKVRCSKYLFTLVIKDEKKAEKLSKSLHPSIKKIEL